MSTAVLVVAGVFVVLGVALIVLSVVLGRRDSAVRAEGDAQDEGPDNAKTFIDEPLETDISTELGATRRVPEPRADIAPDEVAADKAPADEAPAAEDVEADVSENADQPAAAEETGETREDEEESPPAGTGTEQQTRATAAGTSPPESSGLQQVSFNFRVQLGFKYLTNNLLGDAVAEFQKALSLTDDPEAKLKLLVEIGNALRAQGRYGPAAAAYMQADEYTKNDALKEHLARTVAEMTEPRGGPDPANGSDENAGTTNDETGDPGLDKEE